MKNIPSYDEFVNENYTEYPKKIKQWGSGSPTARPHTLTTKKISAVNKNIASKLARKGLKDMYPLKTGESYIRGLHAVEVRNGKGGKLLVNELPEKDGYSRNLDPSDKGKMDISTVTVGTQVFYLVSQVIKDKYGLNVQDSVWMDKEVLNLAEVPVEKEPVPSWAIISAMNPYAHRHSGMEYGWVSNDGSDGPIESMKDFKKMAKRSADNLAKRKFIDHMGGRVHKVYKDVEKFKADYKKLTGTYPNV